MDLRGSLERVYASDFVPRVRARYGLDSEALPPREISHPRHEELAALAASRRVSSLEPDARRRINTAVGRGFASAGASLATGWSSPPPPPRRVLSGSDSSSSSSSSSSRSAGAAAAAAAGAAACEVAVDVTAPGRYQCGRYNPSLGRAVRVLPVASKTKRRGASSAVATAAAAALVPTEPALGRNSDGEPPLAGNGRACLLQPSEAPKPRAHAPRVPAAVEAARPATAREAAEREALPAADLASFQSPDLASRHLAELRAVLSGRRERQTREGQTRERPATAADASAAPPRPSRQSSAASAASSVGERGTLSPQTLARATELERTHLLTELEVLRRQQRVAELLNSAFRRDLEDLIALHAELAAHGLHPAMEAPSGASVPISPAAVTPAPTPTVAGAAAPLGPPASVEARLASLERTVQEQLSALSSRWDAHANESRQMTQLLASSFSLGLSLQEQQARSTAALCALATRIEERHASEPPPPPFVAAAASGVSAHSAAADRTLPPRRTHSGGSAGSASASAAVKALLQDVARQQEQLLLAVEGMQRLQLSRRPLLPRGASRRARSKLRLGARKAAPAGGTGGGGRSSSSSRSSSSHLDDDDTEGLSAALRAAPMTNELHRGAGCRRATRSMPTAAAPPPPPPPTASPAIKMCLLCDEHPADAVLYRCGHRCSCLRCAHYMRHERQPCPLCRAPIEDVVRVFE